MTQFYWVSGNHGYLASQFAYAQNWSPVGVPGSGDQASIVLGPPVIASGTLPTGLTVFVAGGSIEYSGSLVLSGATVAPGAVIQVETATENSPPALPSALQYAGAVINQGTVDYAGSAFYRVTSAETATLAAGTTITNDGVIDVSQTSLSLGAGASGIGIINDGVIRFLNPGGINPDSSYIGPAIGGTGTIGVSSDAGVELAGAIGSGQTLAFDGGSEAGATVTIDQPSLFAATIDGFVAGDTLTLANVSETNASYSNGVLDIFDGGTAAVASLDFSGTYTIADFSLQNTSAGLVITTPVTDPTTGSTATPASTGVYRFFDPTSGAEFLTSSVPERDTIETYLPNFVEQTNGFGAVTNPDASTEAVFRFYNGTNNSWFYTASVAEQNALIASGAAGAYEQGSTFLEDATQQPGDVPVFRLFSTTAGTHFYTASASEAAGLTAAPSGGAPPTYVSEGVAFYAPQGSFT